MNSYDSKLNFLKTQITLARRKLNRVWADRQMTDMTVLEAGVKLDQLCNEYERLMREISRK